MDVPPSTSEQKTNIRREISCHKYVSGQCVLQLLRTLKKDKKKKQFRLTQHKGDKERDKKEEKQQQQRKSA